MKITIRKLAIQHGMTLIELLVAMLIGAFLLLGAVTVYTQGRQNYQTAEGVARVQENMRFVLDVMEPDVQLAGFWGLHNFGPSVTAPGIAVTCNGADVTDWALNVAEGVTALNNITAAAAGEVAEDCPAFGDGIQLDTDVLVVRHASGSAQPLTAGQIQVESNREIGEMMDDGARPAGYLGPPDSNTFNVIVNAWYVAQDSSNLEDVPSLRRRTLLDGVMTDEEVIAGVENMQVQFGLDTNSDGNIDRYVDPEHAEIATSQIISVRLWLLMRSEFEESGFQDGATYTPPDAVLDDITPDDGFRRLVVSKTILLRNFNRNNL